MKDTKKITVKNSWHLDLGDDDLAVLAGEIEDLENDELALNEAGFMQGYESDSNTDQESDEIDSLEFQDGV